jgi:hypothetical protein
MASTMMFAGFAGIQDGYVFCLVLGNRLGYGFGFYNVGRNPRPKKKVGCPHTHTFAKNCLGAYLFYCVNRHTLSVLMFFQAISNNGHVFRFGIEQGKKRRAPEMSENYGIYSVIIKHRQTNFHWFLQHLLKFFPSFNFFKQLKSLLLHRGHSCGLSVPHGIDHACLQAPQIKLHPLISIVPPSMTSCFELTRKSATFLWADARIFPNV